MEKEKENENTLEEELEMEETEETPDPQATEEVDEEVPEVSEDPSENVPEDKDEPIEDTPDDEVSDDESIEKDEPIDEEKEDQSEEGAEKSRPFYLHPVPIIAVIAVIGVAIILILAPVIGYGIISSQTAATEIDITSVQVLSSTDEAIILELGLDVTTPSGISVSFDSLDVDVKYEGSMLGKASISGSDIEDGSTIVQSALVVSDTTIQDAFLQQLLGSSSAPISVNGELNVRSQGILGIIAVPVSIDKDVDVPGLGNIPVTISNLTMIAAHGSYCSFGAHVEFTTQSKISIELEEASFQVTSDIGSLGTITATDLSIGEGTTGFDLVLDSDSVDNDVLRDLATEYLSGRDVTFDIQGTLGTSTGGMVSTAISMFTTNATMEGISSNKGLEFELDSMSVSRFTDALVCDVEGRFYNPSSINGNVSGLVMDISTEGKKFGTVDIDPFYLTAGWNDIHQEAHVRITDPSSVAGIADLYLDGEDVDIVVVPSTTTPGISNLLSSYSFPMTLTNDHPLDISIQGFSIDTVSNLTMDLSVDVAIAGPAGLNGEIGPLTMDLFSGIFEVGTASLSKFDLNIVDTAEGPIQHQTFDTTVTVSNEMYLKVLVSDYLAGRTTDLRARFDGSASTNVSGTLVGDVLSQRSVDIEIEGGSAIELTTNSIDLIGSTADSITVRTNVTIDSPMGIEGALAAFEMALNCSYGPIGTVSIPSLTIDKGTNHLEIDATVSPSQDVIEDLVRAYMEGSDTVIHMQPVEGSDSFITTVLEETSPTVVLRTGSSVTIGDVDYTLTSLDAANGTMGIDVLTTVDNPTMFEVMLEDMRSDLSYGGNKFAYTQLGNISVVPGQNLISRSLTVIPSDLEVLNEVASAYLSGVESTIEVDLRSSFGADCLSNAISESIQFSVGLEGLSAGIDIDIGNMSVIGTSNSSLVMQIDAIVTNPTFVEGPLPDLEFDVMKGASVIGNLTVASFTLLEGTNIQTLVTPLHIDDPSETQAIIDDLLSGTDVEIKAVAADNGNVLSYLLEGYEIDVTLHSHGTVDVQVDDVRLLSADAVTGEMELEVNVTVFNPTDFDVALPLVTVLVGFDNGTKDTDLGSVNLTDLELLAGDNELTLVGNITPYDLTVTRDIITNYLAGENVTLECRADLNLAPDGGSTMDVNVTNDVVLVATRDLEIELEDVTLKDTTSDSVLLGVIVSVYNPTMVRGNVPSMPFEIVYKGSVVGTLDTGELYLALGWNTYELDVNVTSLSSGELDTLVSDYLSGNSVTVTVRAAPTTVLGYLLSGLEFQVSLSTGVSLNISIGNIKLMETTATALSFQVDVGITNPTTLAVGLNNTYLDVYYSGEDIGDLIIDNQTVQPEMNTLTTTLNLSSSNQALLEEIMSNHIGGVNTTLNVTGTYNVTAEGATAPVEWDMSMDVIFEGVEEKIIQGIKVDSVSINIGGPSYTVKITATIHNPTDIPFNMTHMEFDVYFDDPDGASYGFINYGAKNNIFIKSISEDPSPEEEFTSGQTKGYQTQFTDNSLENAVRLNDEKSKGQLKLDIRNGEIDVDIGDFSVTVDFSQENVKVT